jgi:hypothetical protein
VSEHVAVRAAVFLGVALAACGFASGDPPRVFPDPPIDARPVLDAADPDGDGIGADDNCPALANVDQADGDGDRVGDACDSCAAVANPRRATLGEAAPIQRDHDGDGRGDECDLCPHVASTGDVDGDADRIGDLCDPEPAIKNPPAYFDGFYDPPDATWSVPLGGGAITDWEVERRADGTIGWRQRVLDGSKRHLIVRAGETKEHHVDSVIVVERIAPVDLATGLRGAEVIYGFFATAVDQFYFICGVERDEPGNRNLVQGALMQNDTISDDQTAVWPVPFPETRIRVIGQASRVGSTQPRFGDTALSCTAGNAPSVKVDNPIEAFPDGQLGLRTFGMVAWFDYVFYVETVPAT